MKTERGGAGTDEVRLFGERNGLRDKSVHNTGNPSGTRTFNIRPAERDLTHSCELPYPSWYRAWSKVCKEKQGKAAVGQLLVKLKRDRWSSEAEKQIRQKKPLNSPITRLDA